MEPTFFETQADFRKWLSKNHKTEKEVIVGFYKTGSGKKSITWPEAVDQALCFGWIDGVRRGIDKESYCNRFTPRRPGSNWSDINIKKVEELTKQGLMQPEGLTAFEKREESKSRVYSFESAKKELPEVMAVEFKSHKKAWDFFTSQAPSYQKVMIHWIVTAKQEATRTTRLKKLIEASQDLKRIA